MDEVEGQGVRGAADGGVGVGLGGCVDALLAVSRLRCRIMGGVSVDDGRRGRGWGLCVRTDVMGGVREMVVDDVCE